VIFSLKVSKFHLWGLGTVFLNLGVFMKKSLVALAVLAASGASFAQSTVSVYGLLDVWVGSVKTEGGGTSLTQTKLDSGGVSTSRWGLTGSEDLGGGLKTNFKLEQAIAVDSGAGSGFSRYAYVGFSGGFGEVKFGKTGTAYDDVSGASDAMFDSVALAPMNLILTSTTYNWNPANTIYYASPSVSGFAGAFSYSLGENKGAAVAPTLTVNGRTADATSITSLNLTYGAGPLALQFGYQVEGSNVVFVGGAQGSDVKFTRLGASYDLGVVAIKGTYGKVTNVGNVSGADTTDYQIGLDYPVSTALTLSTSYAKSTDNVTAGDESRKGFGAAAAYTLSKRTFVYAGFTNVKATNADTKVTAFAAGVQHKF
jgi:predicted porin